MEIIKFATMYYCQGFFLLICFLYRMPLEFETRVLQEFEKKMAKVINYTSKHDDNVFT